MVRIESSRAHQFLVISEYRGEDSLRCLADGAEYLPQPLIEIESKR